MNILEIKYANKSSTLLLVTELKNARLHILHVPYPSRTWHAEKIQEWLSIEGNEIDPYKTLEDIVEEEDLLRISEIQRELDKRTLSLIPRVDLLRSLAVDAVSNGDSIEQFKLDADAAGFSQ